MNEPVIIDERRDESYRKSVHVRTKHELISEIFFLEHRDLDKDELLMEWCERTDFGDATEAQALINLFGAKKNYTGENAHVDFRKLLDFLLRGHLRESVALSPKLYATPHLAEFWLLLFEDNPDEAIAVLESFLERAPNDLHSRTELAKIYLKHGRLADAEAVLQEILALKPDDLKSRTELGKVYQWQGRLAEAEAVLLKSLGIDPRQLHPRTELAKIYQRQGRLDEPVRRLEEYIELDPKGLHPRTELAKVYRRLGRLDEAAGRAEEVLAIDSLNDHAMSELLGIWEQQGEREKCARRFREFIDQSGYRFGRY